MIFSIPNYFNNSETPIIAITKINELGLLYFNFNIIVTDMNIDSNTPES